MDYRVRIEKDGTLLGERIVRNPTSKNWLSEVVDEIMTPVRRGAGGPVGDYHIKVTEAAPGLL